MSNLTDEQRLKVEYLKGMHDGMKKVVGIAEKYHKAQANFLKQIGENLWRIDLDDGWEADSKELETTRKDWQDFLRKNGL